MPVQKVLIIPHGSMILDPSQEQTAYFPKLLPLHNALQKVIEELTQLNPQTIVLITPHGIALSKNYGIYMNKRAYGRGDQEDPEGKYDKYSVNCDIDTELSQYMLDSLEHLGFEGITQFSGNSQTSLGWAEIVPLSDYFLKPVQSKLCVVSVPSKRMASVKSMVWEAYEIGQEIQKVLAKSDKNIAIVISADLAHTHKIEVGPDVGKEPYGVTEEAQKFDENCRIWAQDPTSEKSLNALLHKNRNLAPIVLSCGYLGLVITAGFLNDYEKQKKQAVGKQVLALEHPTYFGMMVVSYELI